MKRRYETFALCLAALLAVTVLAGCMPSGTTGPSVPGESVPTETQPTVVLPEPSVGTASTEQPLSGEQTVQLRLHDVKSGWWTAFSGENGCFFVADSVDALTQGLSDRGIAPENLELGDYDDGFFGEYRLAVIPRTANSGSVRYSATLSTEDPGKVTITVSARMPEIGTTDMADFLVLVPVPLADYPAELPIALDTAGSPSGSPGTVAR